MAEKITGAEALIKSLIAEGVDTVFGYPGGQIIAVYDKLYDYTGRLNHILVRHEQGAVHAAQGYARVSGKPGVVIVTSGPGAANVVTGLTDALMDNTPLVVITGQVASAFLGTDAFQEADVVAMTQQITKWSVQIRHPEDIPAAVANAFFIASTGRPGPVVLDIAKDAQVGKLEWHHTPVKYIRSYNPRPDIADDVLHECATLLNEAERPLILSGHGVMISDAESALLQVCENGNIPVATTLLGLSTIPSSSPLNFGMLGMHGSIGANIATNRADVILAVGMRFDDRVTGDVTRYATGAKIIHVDIDPSELGKIVSVDVPVLADAGDFLKALAPMLRHKDRTEWMQLFDKCRLIESSEVIEPEIHPQSGKMRAGEVVAAVSEQLGDNAVCVTDVGQNQMFAARYFNYVAPKSIITSGGLGTMGFGLPAAIGAKIAEPQREVCLFCGDGGLQMTIQEFGTILEHNVNVKIILLNNSFLGNVRQWQELFFNSRFSQTPLVNPDFVAVAKAYGIEGKTVEHREDLKDAVHQMLTHDGSYLLNVIIEPTDMVFPMVAPGKAIDEIMLSRDKNFKL